MGRGVRLVRMARRGQRAATTASAAMAVLVAASHLLLRVKVGQAMEGLAHDCLDSRLRDERGSPSRAVPVQHAHEPVLIDSGYEQVSLSSCIEVLLLTIDVSLHRLALIIL